MSRLSQILEELKGYKWLSLSHPVTSEIPHFPIFNPLKIKQLASVSEDGFLCQEVSIGTQYGTHIDAPFHFVQGRETLADYPIKDKILELVVLHLEEEVSANSDYEVNVQAIKDHESQYGPIPPGSFVAFSSGWSQYFEKGDAYYNKDDKGVERTPGWSVEALEYLHEKRQVAGIGHETLNTDSGLALSENGSLVAEYYWLEKNKFQIEVLTNLDQVPSRGSLIKIGFPNIKGASGFNVDVVAIVEE